MHVVSVPKYSLGWRLHFREEFIVPNVGYGVVVKTADTCQICIMRGRLFQTSMELFSFPEVNRLFGDRGLAMAIQWRGPGTARIPQELYKHRRRLFTKRRVLS